jgi:hypothetical protein
VRFPFFRLVILAEMCSTWHQNPQPISLGHPRLAAQIGV